MRTGRGKYVKLKDKISFTKWDVWYAYVKYEGIDGGKIRPVIIMDAGVLVLDCFPVYGSPSENGQYEIQEWAFAGLGKPSTVSLTPMEIGAENFAYRVGSLHIADRRKIVNLIGN
jgi:hypothetical protein